MKLLKPNNNNKTLIPEAPAGQPIPEFYTNMVGINVSPYEFEFATMLVDSKGQMKGAINIRMSPQTAKSLLGALHSQVTEYEKNVGEIVLPE